MKNSTWQFDTMWIMITGKCNLKCKHCYQAGTSIEGTELEFEKICDALNQASIAGIKRIHITGGEPFFRKDIRQILRTMKSMKFIIEGIETNGMIITPEDLNILDKNETIFYVSYDGKGYHNYLRGTSDAEDKAINSISNLQLSGFKVIVYTTVTHDNIEQIIGSFELLSKQKISEWRINPITPIGSRWQTKKPVDTKSLADLYIRIKNIWLEAGRPFGLRLGSILAQRFHKGHLKKPELICDYFSKSVLLLPDGRLIPCCRFIAAHDMMQDMRSIFEYPIEQQIESSILRNIKTTKFNTLLDFPENKRCKECELLKLCQMGCRMDAYLNYGSFWVRDQQHCKIMREYYLDEFKAYDYYRNEV